MSSQVGERIENVERTLEFAEANATPWWLKKLYASEKCAEAEAEPSCLKECELVAKVLGLSSEDMEALALIKGKQEIEKTIKETQKRSNQEKQYEDLTHKEDLVPTIADNPKLSQPLEEMEMILEALFGHSENPTVLAILARGLEGVLQTLAIQAFSKKRVGEEDFNKEHLHTLFDLNEQA